MGAIFSTEKGQGNAVVLLHGFCETHEIWNGLSQSIANNYKIYTPDLPGFGKSPLPDVPFSLSHISASIICWMEEKKISKPVVIGHSLGGYLALEIARHNSDLISGLGLFHSTAQADSLEKKENRNKVAEFVTKHGAELFLDSFVPSLFYNKDNPIIKDVRKICGSTQSESIVNYALAMRDRPDYQDILSRLRIPILFICGERDPFVPLEVSKNQSALCRNSELAVLLETGHLGMVETVEKSIEYINMLLLRCF